MPTTRLLDSPCSVPMAILRVLQEAGANVVFGLSGGNTSLLFEALGECVDSIRTVLVRNEAYATAAAEAYARTSGRVGVAVAQGSWLMGQGVVGTLEALLGGAPILLL